MLTVRLIRLPSCREACTMYFLARLKDLSEDTWLGPLVAEEGEAQSTFDLYLTSLYLSVVTFCTVGTFQDIVGRHLLAILRVVDGFSFFWSHTRLW